jgi:hypothetical protein
VTTEYSRGANRESFGDATSEVATLDFNKVHQFDTEDGDSPSVVIAGTGWMCKQGGCQDIVKIGISAPRQEEARAIESKRHAIDFIKKACPGLPRDRRTALTRLSMRCARYSRRARLARRRYHSMPAALN